MMTFPQSSSGYKYLKKIKINGNQCNLSSALVFKNLKTFVANVLALVVT